MKNTITQAHLDANPDLKLVYVVGDSYDLPKVPSGCDASNPNDAHHGQAGSYDSNCNWIPDVG